MSFADFARQYLPITHPKQIARVAKPKNKRHNTVSGFGPGDRVQCWADQNYRPGVTGTVTRTWGDYVYVDWDRAFEERMQSSWLLLIGSDEHREANARFGIAA